MSATDVGDVGDLAVDLVHETNHTVITLQGELTMHTAADLRQAVIDLAADGHHNLVIDLAGMELIDAAGLGALVGGLKRVRQQGGDLILHSPRPAADRVLRMTGLAKVFVIE